MRTGVKGILSDFFPPLRARDESDPPDGWEGSIAILNRVARWLVMLRVPSRFRRVGVAVSVPQNYHD